MRRLLGLLAALALVAVVVVGLGQAGDDGGGAATEAPSFALAEAREQLRGAPPELAALHAQASEVLPGGKDAFDARIEELEGHPVVVNKWASWCAPCRAEFPVFQRVATERGKEVAFLGVNTQDVRTAAEGFLAERPLPFPSYEDPDDVIGRALKASSLVPATAFIDEQGNLEYTHFGEYTSAAELEADIDRYLG